MTRIATTISTNTTVEIGRLHRPRPLTNWQATFFAKGTFGGGTLSWFWADNNDTVNLLPLTDYTGASITSTANDSFNVTFGNGNKINDDPRFFGTLAGGSTLASITLGYYDNNG